MKESQQGEKRFNFKKYQNAKTSRRILVRFVIYTIVISIILYLILEKSKTQDEIQEDERIEHFEIE